MPNPYLLGPAFDPSFTLPILNARWSATGLSPSCDRSPVDQTRNSSCAQDRGDLVVAPRLGMLERRHAIPVGEGQVGSGLDKLAYECRNPLCIHAKGLGTAPHAHARAFQIKVGIDAHG